MKLASCWKPSSKPTVARLVPSISHHQHRRKTLDPTAYRVWSRTFNSEEKKRFLSELTAAEGLNVTSVQNSLVQNASRWKAVSVNPDA